MAVDPGRLGANVTLGEVRALRPSDAPPVAATGGMGPALRRAQDEAGLAVFEVTPGQQIRGDAMHHTQYAVGPVAEGLNTTTAHEASQLRAVVSVGVVLTLGVVGWSAQGMALMTSVLVSSPAWRSFDLLPVLRQRREDADWGDESVPDTLDDPSLDDVEAPERSEHVVPDVQQLPSRH